MPTKKQIQLIHVAKSKLALDDEAYKDILKARYNVDSSKALSERQAKDLIDFFKQKGFKIKKKKKVKDEKIIELATYRQKALIEILKKNVVWREENGYERYINKRLHIKRVITKEDASKVINALKGLIGVDSNIVNARALPFPKNYQQVIDGDKNFIWFFDLQKGTFCRAKLERNRRD